MVKAEAFWHSAGTGPFMLTSYVPSQQLILDRNPQYWGGPATYNEQRGHPRLRMRHAPFVIGALERDAWLRHMGDALGAAGIDPDDEAEIAAYFEMAANSLMNAR